MAESRRIAVVTGTRAEYGLLRGLMRAIAAAPGMQLQVLVTGMHLSPEFGLTWKDIVADGFQIDRKVEMLLSSDTAVGASKSIGLGVGGFADALDELRPDLMLVLGDRFEMLAAVTAATMARIPIAHLHGGETTEGAFDESIRHCITKMSHLHFPSTEAYRRRIIQLGEDPVRVFNVGAPGLDNIRELQPMSREELEASLDFRFGERNLLVTFHPETLEHATAEAQFEALLGALGDLERTHLIFTFPNADPGGRIIARMIEDFVAAHPDTATSAVSLGMRRYLSAMVHVDGVVGNSSSGIIEAPGFNIGTVNIGDRQRGRVQADSVINCAPERTAISAAFDRLFSDEFRAGLANVSNPYGDGHTVEAIMKVLTDVSLDDILKKRFNDLPVNG